jgi:hypothetical protein
MNNDCPRAGRWIGGCNFEARYDRIPPDRTGDFFFDQMLVSEIQARTKRVYVCDVCTRCGQTIKRDAK